MDCHAPSIPEPHQTQCKSKSAKLRIAASVTTGYSFTIKTNQAENEINSKAAPSQTSNNGPPTFVVGALGIVRSTDSHAATPLNL